MKKNLNKRTGNMESLEDIIGHVLRAQSLEETFNDKRIEEAWSLVAGSAFMKHTTKVKARKGVLYLGLSSSIVRNELMMAKRHIISNLNKELKSDLVKNIIFG